MNKAQLVRELTSEKGRSKSYAMDLLDKFEQDLIEKYGHPAESGWCCACDYDIMTLRKMIKDIKGECNDKLIKVTARYKPK